MKETHLLILKRLQERQEIGLFLGMKILVATIFVILFYFANASAGSILELSLYSAVASGSAPLKALTTPMPQMGALHLGQARALPAPVPQEWPQHSRQAYSPHRRCLLSAWLL